MSEQKKAEEFGITEDDVSEIRQDINKFRFELVDILRKNNFDIGKVRNDGCYSGKRAKQMERRIMKVISGVITKNIWYYLNRRRSLNQDQIDCYLMLKKFLSCHSIWTFSQLAEDTKNKIRSFKQFIS